MEFKIDTKSGYTLITPVTNQFDANLAAALRQKCEELTRIGSQNFIIDLHQCANADNASFPEVIELHTNCYSNGQSLVFTGIQDGVLARLKEEGTDTAINIAPSFAEAVDIISMEILERDLFNEES